MKVCPDCNKISSDEMEFCNTCGAELVEWVFEPRIKAMDNLRYAYETARTNTKVFYPYLMMIGGMIGLVIVAVLGLGLSLSGFESSDSSSVPWVGIGLFLVIYLGMAYLGLVSIPMFQDVYKNAILKIDLDFRKSFDYGRSRVGAYIAAYIIIGFAWAILGFGVIMPLMDRNIDMYDFDPSMSPETIGYEMMGDIAPAFLIMLPFAVLVGLALHIMAWDNVEFGQSLRLSWKYFRSRWRDLLVIGLIGVILSGLFGIIPFGAIISYAILIIINLALIDNYLSYKTTLIPELSPGISPED